ncbi:MAG: hypothetical protein AAB262_05605 [Elusimicrobiota bacterium]|mgnify:CR=1 FL=1
MLHGDSAHLMSALSQYGYSLLQPEQMADPNELLANLAKSKDARLVEGFPVVLANALEKHQDKLDLGAAEKLLDDESSRARFRKLTALSLYLFDVFGLEKLRPKELADRLGRGNLLAELRNAVEHNQPLALHPGSLDLERVKKTFLRYYMRASEVQASETKAQLREEFQREFYFSQFFAPKQRDLVEKKLRGEPLTKTEREYFSRVVKKKLLALADPDLHRLAQKALQSP